MKQGILFAAIAVACIAGANYLMAASNCHNPVTKVMFDVRHGGFFCGVGAFDQTFKVNL